MSEIVEGARESEGARERADGRERGGRARARPGTASGGALRGAARAVRRSAAFWYAVAVLLVVGVWQGIIVVAGTPDYLLPSPRQVLSAMAEYREPLLSEGLVTLGEILLGFAISAVAGIALAVPIAFSRAVERLAYPLLVMSQAVPKIALGPLFIVWFGFGLTTNVVIAVSVAIFPVIVNTALGLSSIDPDLVRLGRSMGASRWRLFRLVRLPTALPSVLAGLKVASTLAVIGVVVGEFIVGGAGLGYLTISASGNQNVPLLFACVICLAVLGVAVFAVLDLLERVLLRRHAVARSRG
ncbi:ABC transporter permease [Actinomadura sp. WMMB 499]|uniref:ABC transporter permease n=1 Tax=Actinomadura sp. WMMB 499 TaxID=1219491 RepID=UPI0012441235|nr:ABC transporter permease [Actinomadura sp. WMMB 499]QFG21344.1 ABC transporter permease [Actinomadura sp. WMMB 499]